MRLYTTRDKVLMSDIDLKRDGADTIMLYTTRDEVLVSDSNQTLVSYVRAELPVLAETLEKSELKEKDLAPIPREVWLM